METLSDLFIRFVPLYLHASCVKNGIYKCDRVSALASKYIALNTKNYRKSITIDVDRKFDGEDFYEKIYEKGIPPPNYVVISPETEHYHLIYLLPIPVKKGSSLKAEHAFKYIQKNLTLAWGGDEGYTNHLMKNPLHPHWITHEIWNEGYSLQELIAWSVKQDFGIKPEKRRHIDESVENPRGRNCTLFDLMREYAYRNKERSYDALYKFASERNEKGYKIPRKKNPMEDKEVSTIVESVHGFMQGYTGKGGWGQQYTDEQRKKSLETRRVRKWNRIHRFIEYRKMKLSLKEIAKKLEISRKTLYQYIKELSDSNNIIVKISEYYLNILDTKVNGSMLRYSEFPVIVPDTS